MSNSKKILTTLAACTSLFAAVLYTSCTKQAPPATDTSCNNVVCNNGGICLNGLCNCPNGYEDLDCGTPSISRYLGTWTVHDSVVGSNHPSIVDSTQDYNIDITAMPGSPARFYINGITGNPGFVNLPCEMQDTLTRAFNALQFRSTDRYGYATPSPMTVVYCIGVMNNGGYYIHGRYVREYPLADSTLQVDTLSYYALKQ